MEFFDKLFGKKQKKSNGSAPPQLPVERRVSVPSMPANDPLAEFAMKASKAETTIEIQFLQVSKLINLLQESLQKEYPSIDSGEMFRQAEGGLTLRCPRCGQLSDQAVPYLYMAGSDIMKNAVFMGPNVAALSQGKCPGCGGTRAYATFNPAKVKARDAALTSSAAETTGVPALKPSMTFPYLASISISPNEETVAWVRGGKPGQFEIVIASTETGAEVTHFNHPGFEYPPACTFVGNDRLLVKTKLTKEIKNVNLALFDAASGKKVCEIDAAECYFSNPSVNHDTRTIAAEMDTFNLMILDAADDKLVYRTIKTGQIYHPGPKFGPDGKIYLIVHFTLYRIEEDKMVQVMKGDHCICFDPAGKIYSGGGYGDRSGDSFFHVADLKSGATTDISWGRDPVSQIELAGEGEVLIATTVDQAYAAKNPNAIVSLFSLGGKKKKWTIEINDLKPYVRPVLASAPKEGWALLQTGRSLKQISLKDGKTLKTIAKQPQEIAGATWLPTKKMMGVTRIPAANSLGTLEWFKME